MRFAFHKIRALHLFLILGICLSFSISVLSVTAEAENEVFAHTTEEVYADLAYSEGVELVPLSGTALELLSTPAAISCGANSCLNSINDNGSYECYELQSNIFAVGSCQKHRKKYSHWFHSHYKYKWTCTIDTEPLAGISQKTPYWIKKNSNKALRIARDLIKDYCPSDTYFEADGKKAFYCISNDNTASSETTSLPPGVTSTTPISAQYSREYFFNSCDMSYYANSACSGSKKITKFSLSQSTQEWCQNEFETYMRDPSSDFACKDSFSDCHIVTWVNGIGTCSQSPFDTDNDGINDVFDVDGDWNTVSEDAFDDINIFELEYDAEHTESFLHIAGIEKVQKVSEGPNDPVTTTIEISNGNEASISDIDWGWNFDADGNHTFPNGALWTSGAFNRTVELMVDDETAISNTSDAFKSFFTTYAFVTPTATANVEVYNDTPTTHVAHAIFTLAQIPYNISITASFATEQEALDAITNDGSKTAMNTALTSTLFEIELVEKNTNILTYTPVLRII